MSQPTDQLVRAAVGGNLAAFNALVELHQRQVYNVCYRLLGNADDAADATQDAFFSAYRAVGTFHADAGGFRPWLLRIATNACYDQLRRRQRRPTESLDHAHGDDADDAGSPSPPDPSPGPELQALTTETGSAIERALARLSVDQRTVVVLCDVQGLHYDEVAEVLGVELGTVKSRLSRARAQLRDLLRAAGELPASSQRLDS